MCDPKPGARCSADTRKELSRAQAAHASASREVERHPEDPSARRRLDQAGRNLGEKWAAYDSSPQGQKDLLAAIGEAPNPSSPDVDALRTHLFIGRRTRVEQKQALARARGLSVEEGTLQGDKVLSRLRHPDGGFTRHPDTGREESLGVGRALVWRWEWRRVRCPVTARRERRDLSGESRGVGMVVETLGKSGLIAKVAASSGQTQAATQQVIEGLLQVFADAVATDTKVSVPGWVSVERTQRAARAGRNPATGETIQIPATNGVKLTAGSKLKAAAK